MRYKSTIGLIFRYSQQLLCGWSLGLLYVSIARNWQSTRLAIQIADNFLQLTGKCLIYFYPKA